MEVLTANSGSHGVVIMKLYLPHLYICEDTETLCESYFMSFHFECIIKYIGGGTGGALGARAPTLFCLGGQCPHNILLANRTYSVTPSHRYAWYSAHTVSAFRVRAFPAHFNCAHAHRCPHTPDWVTPPMKYEGWADSVVLTAHLHNW